MHGTFNVVEGSQLQKVMQEMMVQETKSEPKSGAVQFTLSNHNPTKTSAESLGIQNQFLGGQDKENQSQQSFGTGSFTTNTFNNYLKDSNGMSILKYIQDENFGQYGESIKLIECMNVSA